MKNKNGIKPGSTKINKTGGWRTYRPEFDFKKCTGCGTCARICPEGIIAIIKIKDKIKSKTNYDFCKGCGLCAEECPAKAIKMKLEKK